MKKKLLYLFFIVVILEIPFILHTVKSYGCAVFSLETDKKSYYTNEEIRINASWTLDYDPFSEYAYIQLNIYDSLNNHIWNSSWYDEIGFFTEQWTINTTQLGTIFSNYSNEIYIRLYFYFWDGELHPFLKDTEEITIYKRIPLCDLIGFKNRINYSEDLTFSAKFYDNELENGSLMKNQFVILKIKANGTSIFLQNFTTDQFGCIDVSLSSLEHLEVGLNTLIFEIGPNNVYNNTIFQYEVLVERNPVFINIIEINNQLIKKENLFIQLRYYYYFNNLKTPLKNQSIKIEIHNRQKLIYSYLNNTDNDGILLFIISRTILNITDEVDEITLIFQFYGNKALQNKTISFFLNIENLSRNNSLDTNTILIITTSIISLVAPFPIIYKMKKGRKKMLTEVIIKY